MIIFIKTQHVRLFFYIKNYYDHKYLKCYTEYCIQL
jgi:hypothetical protein